MNLEALSDLLVRLKSPHEFFIQRGDSVHHYTDLGGLHGIVSAQDLWLTDSRYSNDFEELKHGFSVVDRLLTQLLEDNRSTRQKAGFLRGVKIAIEESRETGVYVCCFCRTDDLLGQWRSYGSNGTGVSLRVSTTGFEFVAGPDMPPDTIGLVYLWNVSYDAAKQEQLIKECLNEVWKRPEKIKDKVVLATDALRFFIPTFKNEAFSEEQEVRLVFAPAPDCPVSPDFRVARGMLVPYYSLRALVQAAGRGIWRLPIESVRVGPGPLRSENRRSVELFLRGSGYPGTEVMVSETPYRG